MFRLTSKIALAATVASSMTLAYQHCSPTATQQGSIPSRLIARALVSHNQAASSKAAPLSPQDELKRQVGYKAVDDYIRSDMIVGLGTGSTAYYAVERLGEKLAKGQLKNIKAIPTSEATKRQAESLKIPLISLSDLVTVEKKGGGGDRGGANGGGAPIDVAIDGADDVDCSLSLVKGGGGALLREKMVENVAKKLIIIVDESKLSHQLGKKFPLPVEIIPFAYEYTIHLIESLPSLQGSGVKGILRYGNVSNNKKDGENIAITDNGNYIVDLHFSQNLPQETIQQVGKELTNIVGVVEHGLFVHMADTVIIAGKTGIKIAGKDGEKPWW